MQGQNSIFGLMNRAILTRSCSRFLGVRCTLEDFQFFNFFSSSAMRGIEMPQEEGELNEGETASIIGRFGLPLIEFHSMRALERRRGEPISQIQDLTNIHFFKIPIVK